jgi:hypothetical protein
MCKNNLYNMNIFIDFKEIIIKYKMLLLFTLLFTSCTVKDISYTKCKNININALEEDIKKYQILVEKNILLREQTITFAKQLKKISPLSAKDIDTIRFYTKYSLNKREELLQYIKEYECILYDEQSTITSYNKLKATMVSLSSALILYDNYLLALSILQNDKRLRKFINSHDTTYAINHNSLEGITNNYNKSHNKQRIKNAINYYKRNIHLIEMSKNDDSMQYLHTLIQQSPSYQKKKFGGSVTFKIKVFTTKVVDLFRTTISGTSEIFSEIFGNITGLVETRKGKLYKNEPVLYNIQKNLKAGDILLEKTPFRLTDSLIPGFWGHVAINIGTKDELIDLGIWNHKVVKKYHKEILDGKSIVEALRSGVKMNTLEHFLNIDDFANLRYKNEVNSDLAKRIILTLGQVGKKYDFNFDVESSDKIVCSELVYITSVNHNYKTEKLIGRHTISPDNVAYKSIEDNSVIKIVTLINDNQIIYNDKIKYMKKLINK